MSLDTLEKLNCLRCFVKDVEMLRTGVERRKREMVATAMKKLQVFIILSLRHAICPKTMFNEELGRRSG